MPTDPAPVMLTPTGLYAIPFPGPTTVSCAPWSMVMPACPFGNMLWDETYRCVQKCDLCGGEPRCVPFCPTGALLYVPAEDAATRPEPLNRGELVAASG